MAMVDGQGADATLDHAPRRGGRAVMLRVENWLKRADAILAQEVFDLPAALSLVREIRNQTGPGTGSIGIAAGQAMGSLQAADRTTRSEWQIAVGRQRFQAVRQALARHASRP